MPVRTLAFAVTALFTLTGCFGPTKPEISSTNPALPFNQAMDAVIGKDEFLKEFLRPGFYRAADGSMESYVVTPDEEGGPVIDQVVLLTRDWCGRNGGQLENYPELPVLQRGVGNVIQRRENQPVTGQAYNMVCWRGREALAAAVIGRDSYFLNGAQFRQAARAAGATVLKLKPVE